MEFGAFWKPVNNELEIWPIEFSKISSWVYIRDDFYNNVQKKRFVNFNP